MKPRRARGRLPRGRAPGTPRGRRGTARRLIAATVMVVAVFTLAALGAFAAVSNRVTRPELTAGLIVFAAAAVAAAYLRHDRLHGSKP